MEICAGQPFLQFTEPVLVLKNETFSYHVSIITTIGAPLVVTAEL